MANMNIIHPMCSSSSREIGVAKLAKLSPSCRSSKADRTTTPKPTQELGIIQEPTLAPLHGSGQ